MAEVKVVIGANFGDEGKGMMTDYFCRKAAGEGKSGIVVCHNGGPQRGHTVVTAEGIRHVFHHFGSGTFAGADTYFSSEFLINPMIFRKEWEELKKYDLQTKLFVHPDCSVTCFYDMLLNQIAEIKRGSDRHGSCGMGILETIHRSGQGYKMQVGDLYVKSEKEIYAYLEDVEKNYLPQRLKELGIGEVPSEFCSMIRSGEVKERYIEDVEFFKRHVNIQPESRIFTYDQIVFEGGQGLLLDQNMTSYMPHLTPSNTGSKNPADILNRNFYKNLETEVCYVTRSYLTRHGAGRLDTECGKEDICAGMQDLTNVPNPYQGTLRYGWMDVHGLKERIEQDYEIIRGKHTRLAIAITHLNESEGFFASRESWSEAEFFQGFDWVYRSFGEIMESYYSQPSTLHS